MGGRARFTYEEHWCCSTDCWANEEKSVGKRGHISGETIKNLTQRTGFLIWSRPSGEQEEQGLASRSTGFAGQVAASKKSRNDSLKTAADRPASLMKGILREETNKDLAQYSGIS